VTAYAICVTMTEYPAYNAKATTYETYTYDTYAPCKRFSWNNGTSNSQNFGTSFTFGGPGTYRVDWYVPDFPANGGTAVGTTRTFRWADSAGTYSPCPPDPQLQIGVWRPSRHQILNRCKTITGSNGSSSIHYVSKDQDRGWSLAFSSTSLHTEYMMRDQNTLPSPSSGSTWTITGVYVCDLYTGATELHPVFQAKNSSGTTYLTGPQYGTVTPTVTGTWSLKSCG
jgi:hypothetical protein